MSSKLIRVMALTFVLGWAGGLAVGQDNQIVNGEFDDGLTGWGRYGTTGFDVSAVRSAGLSGPNAVLLDVTNAAAATSIGIAQSGLLLEPGKTYPLGFTAKAQQSREKAPHVIPLDLLGVFDPLLLQVVGKLPQIHGVVGHRVLRPSQEGIHVREKAIHRLRNMSHHASQCIMFLQKGHTLHKKRKLSDFTIHRSKNFGSSLKSPRRPGDSGPRERGVGAKTPSPLRRWC